jgi:predicted phosphodiesterase
MRVFALSDIHVDHVANARWVAGISTVDYRDDVLILAGDVTDSLDLMAWCLETLARRFAQVLFVPGNHDLWVVRDSSSKTSLQKLDELETVVASSGASMLPMFERGLSIVPLFGWYDYSFGQPTDELRSMWMDYRACRWPPELGQQEIAEHFEALNSHDRCDNESTVITFSHFLPRIDVMPAFIPDSKRLLYPVLGTTRLERRLRMLKSTMHVYGHSHVNRNVRIDGVSYINNALGYPDEVGITAKRLLCVHQC